MAFPPPKKKGGKTPPGKGKKGGKPNPFAKKKPGDKSAGSSGSGC